MKTQKHKHPKVSLAERTGFVALAMALLLGLIHVNLAIIPLTLFLLLCFTAPLIPGLSFFLPIVSRGDAAKNGVALTFDDGPDPVSTPKLLELLKQYQVKATFFVNGQNAEKYPKLIQDILSKGHTIGNHTYSHDNFIMLKTSRRLMKEIEDTQRALEPFGVIPIAFRPPVGVTSPRLKNVLKKLGMYTVNFNRRAGDLGNRRIGKISKRILKNLKSGDIVMLHDIKPRSKASLHIWFNEIDQLLAGIKNRPLKILPLAELIDRPVMNFIKKESH